MERYEELKKNVSILLVDDDTDYIEVTAFFLKSKGYNVDIAIDGEEAIKKVEAGNVHIVLLDYYMPGMTGEEVVNKIREFNKEIIIILQTGFAGKQPPSDTLTRLNIQNYHDKSDGVEKLLLQVMSAVRIFNQQNEIILSKYRVNAIGRLIKGIAEDLKSPLMSIGAGLEASNTLIESSQNELNRDAVLGLKKFYENNKTYVEHIDKILSAVINQTSYNNKDEYLNENEIVERIELILSNELKTSGVILDKEIILKPNTLIYGPISDVIFILCEIIEKVVKKLNIGDKIELGIKEDESFWYFSIESEKVRDIERSEKYIIRNIISGIENVVIEEIADKLIIGIKKNKN